MPTKEEELEKLWNIITDLRKEKRERWAREPSWLDDYIKRLDDIYTNFRYQKEG